MDKTKAVKMGEELMKAAEKIAEKYNMNVKRGSGKYDDCSYKMNNITFFEVEVVEFNKPSNQPVNKFNKFTRQEQNTMKLGFDMIKKNHGLEDVEVGQTFLDSKGRDMMVLGWKSRNRKYPVLIQNTNNGNVYKVTPKHLWFEMKLK